jgi:putative restriction endonuclease
VRIVVGVTDSRWATFLRDHPSITEANFWQPSPHSFKALTEGEPFLFKTKHPRTFPGLDMPGYALVGGGFFEQYFEMTVSEAWTIWGRGNGASNELELLQRVQSYRDSKNHEPVPDPTIGCVILRNIFFADPGRELPQPPNWSPNNVTIEGYETVGRGRKVDSEYVLEAFQLLQGRARVDFAWDTDLAGVAIEWDGPKLGAPILTRPRMGQGRFRRAVDEAYSYRCAVTGSRTYPSLEAAHIRDFALDGGSHAVSNALLLRSDVHALYDRGYLGIDADLRLRVSPELRANGWNGVEFYEREAAGFRISVPEPPHLRPSRDALDWHFRTKFRTG